MAFIAISPQVLTKVLQKCSLSRPLPNISLLSKPLNLIGCHSKRNAKFAKTILKHLRSHNRIKLKLSRNGHNIGLYNKRIFYFVVHVHSLLRQLKISMTYDGKSENWRLLLAHCRFYRNVPLEVLYETYHFLFKCPNLIGCHGNRKAKCKI